METNNFQFSRLAVHWKLMVTGFVIILGSGYLAAVFNAALSVGMTPQAIADHYADKSLTPAEIVMMEKQGFIEEEFSLDDEPEEKMDMSGMNHEMPGGMNHDMSGDMSGMDMGDMNGMDMGGMHGKQGDDTLPPQILAQVSHVHLLVFSILFLILASLLCLTQLTAMTKAVGVVLLFAGLWGDIISLNLVRFVSANFSWLTVAMGTLVGLTFAFIIFRVFWELWFVTPKETA